MYKAKIEKDLKNAVKELGFVAPDTVCSISENAKFGDYVSNVALQLSKQKHKNTYQTPQEIANAILEKFGHPDYLERAEIAGPGFINFYLNDKALLNVILARFAEADARRGIKEPPESAKDSKRILVEYGHPNTHKAYHIGHLRNVSIGESISRLLEYQKNLVFRVTYGGDIGPHVAKALWGVVKLKDEYQKTKELPLRQKAEFLGRAYTKGSTAYEENDDAKKEIDEINEKLYENDPDLKEIWHETKIWSIAYFDSIYSRVGTEFDAEIWESEIYESGVLLTEENTPRVFEKDDGAIIFPGEKYGLHNRVFITGKGYPTYEAKELGLTQKEQELFPYDRSLHIVANEQQGFFDVTTKALELIDPGFTGKKKHLSYGMVNLSSGKMSSRKGEVITADSLIEDVKKTISENYPDTAKASNEANLDKIAIGAIKFYYLKYALSSDIAFDIEQSVSLHGDSGPYLMYTYARTVSLQNRAKSNLAGAKNNRAKDSEPEVETAQAQNEKIAQRQTLLPRLTAAQSNSAKATPDKPEPEERELLRLLDYFEAIVENSAKKFSPNELCNYLLTLAKQFNFYYESHPIIEAENSDFRLALTRFVGGTIKTGLYLLGIETVDRM